MAVVRGVAPLPSKQQNGRAKAFIHQGYRRTRSRREAGGSLGLRSALAAWLCDEAGSATGSGTGGRMGEFAAFILSTGESTERCATDVVWCRWVAVTRISATPWNDLAPPPGGAFVVWHPPARAVQPTVVLCLWVCRLIGKPVHVCRLSPLGRGAILRFAVKEFAFEVVLIARVRVRAADEASARRVVPNVIGAPGMQDIALANQGIDVLLPGVMVTAVDFIPDRKVKLVRR